MKVVVMTRENSIRIFVASFIILFIAFITTILAIVSEAQGVAKAFQVISFIVGLSTLGYFFKNRKFIVTKKSNLTIGNAQLTLNDKIYRLPEIDNVELIPDYRNSKVKLIISIKKKVITAFYADNWNSLQYTKVEKHFQKEIKALSEGLKEKFIIRDE